MGWRYSIDLFFELDRLEDALRGIAAMAVSIGEPMSVLLPSGCTTSFPFQLAFGEKNREIRSGQSGPQFEIVLRFPYDDGTDDDLRMIGGMYGGDLNDGFIDLGMIDLTIHAGTQYAEISLAPSESTMRVLLRVSSTVHRQLQGLIERTVGIVGLIYVEDDIRPLLSDPTNSVDIDARPFDIEDYDPEQGGLYFDVDGFTAALLTKLEQMGGGDDGDQGIAAAGLP